MATSSQTNVRVLPHKCAACGRPCGSMFRMYPENWPVCGPCIKSGQPELLRMELYGTGAAS